jgi:hypothetical protein
MEKDLEKMPCTGGQAGAERQKIDNGRVNFTRPPRPGKAPRTVAFKAKASTVRSPRIAPPLGIEAAAAALAAAVRRELEARAGRISFSDINTIWVARTRVGLLFSDGTSGSITSWPARLSCDGSSFRRIARPGLRPAR